MLSKFYLYEISIIIY